MKTNTLWKKLAHPDGSSSVVFAPDGKSLATGDVNGVIRVWDVETPSPRQRLDPRREPAAMALSFRGRGSAAL